MYFVYFLKCKNGTIYTGITTDVDRRFKEHQSGKGGHYTRSAGAVEIIYTERHKNRAEALRREAQLKGWRREKKLTLIKS